MDAVIYARVSSVDDSQSNDRQIDDLQRFAEYKKLNVIKIFAEKISGYSKGLNQRVEFNKMVLFIEKKNVKHILISELSRLSRRNIDTVQFIHNCSKRGVNIHIQKEGLSTLNEDGTENPTVRMVTGILSNMANMESENLSYRIKSGKRHAASKGLAFSPKIYGYDKGKDGKPIINSQEAILVEKMFEMTLEGHGARKIANYLNQNYKTKEWKTGSINSILRNSFYCGKRKYKEMIIDVPSIVSENIFNKTQEFINSRKRYVSSNSKFTNPFASFIKCKCGAPMHQIIIKKTRTELYRCKNNCGIKSVNIPFLIKEVKKVLERNAKQFQEEEIKQRLKQNIQIDLSNISSCQLKIRSLKIKSDRNYDRFLEDKINEKSYNAHELRFTTEIDSLKKEIEALKSNVESTKAILSNKIMHYSDDLEVFKSQILKVINYIEIREKYAIINFKGWFKYTFLLYRGPELQKYNNGSLKFKYE